MRAAGGRGGRDASAGPDRLKEMELAVRILIPTLTPDDGDNNATINLKRL